MEQHLLVLSKKIISRASRFPSKAFRSKFNSESRTVSSLKSDSEIFHKESDTHQSPQIYPALAHRIRPTFVRQFYLQRTLDVPHIASQLNSYKSALLTYRIALVNLIVIKLISDVTVIPSDDSFS